MASTHEETARLSAAAIWYISELSEDMESPEATRRIRYCRWVANRAKPNPSRLTETPMIGFNERDYLFKQAVLLFCPIA